MDTSLSIEELRVLLGEVLIRLSELESENGLLKKENEALKKENAELRIRLNLKSHNSHKPPSSDGLKKQPAIPKEKGKSVGGQKDHAGHSLKMELNPDKVAYHVPDVCICCGKTFSELDIVGSSHKRQVFDIPEPRLLVTEHRLGHVSCCGVEQVGSFPSNISSPVQYGHKIKALSVLLNTEYRLPYEKISQLFGDIYGCSFNESTAVSANEACYEALAQPEAEIKAEILSSEVVHFDETGMRVEGKLHWFHTACMVTELCRSTKLFTYLFVHKKRGKEALEDEKSLIKDFKNWAIHDCWGSYFDFKTCKHGICGAHIIRELVALQEQNSIWAKEMHDFLFELYKKSEKATIIVADKPLWMQKFQAICDKADAEEPLPIKNARGKPKNSKGRNLLNRLIKHQDGILAFAFELAIPFSNNQAERDIRCVKVKQKVAMSFRTFKGAEIYARIQGFISTARKHHQNSFSLLCALFQGHNIVWNQT
jgi:transposase